MSCFPHKGVYGLMVGMSPDPYLTLIEDTLSYIEQLQPKALESEEVQITLPPPPKPAPKPQAKPPPKPLPPAPLPQKKGQKDSSFIDLEPPPVPQKTNNIAVLKTLREIDPDLYLHEKVPSDQRAQRIKGAWKEKRGTPAIPILFQGQAHRSFVTNIAKAIDTLYGSCRIVEIEPQKKWDLFLDSENLKLIIAPDTMIFGTKELLPFYQENPQQKTRKLGNIPLLLLPDLSLYFKDPYLKRALWNIIRSFLTA